MRETKINREDMLELTRRMTVKRTSFTRIAGAYLDMDGEIDGTFNTNFLKLTPGEREKNLAVAKEIPFAETNRNLKRYRFSGEGKQTPMYRLLMEICGCGLKNDALLETFYEEAGRRFRVGKDYAVFVFHDRYDVPAKAADHERLWESEEVFEYLICAFCPLKGDYEPGKPFCGFLFPAFSDRSADLEHIDVFQADPEHPCVELYELLGI